MIRVLVFSLLVASVIGCSTDEECNLNGLCTKNACACNAGWTGTACASLSQTPVKLDSQGNLTTGYIHSDYSSWGGSVIHGSDNLYHAFIAQFTNGCPLAAWETNSFVVHAVSSDVEGPFELKGSVLPVFHHNPSIAQAPDGTFLLYSIGGQWNGTQVKCQKGASKTLRGGNTGLIALSYSKSLEGPWTLFEGGKSIVSAASWFSHPTNPSRPVFASDGSLLMVLRVTADSKESLVIAKAPSWKGPYTIVGDKPIIDIVAEDPFMWKDVHSNYHILYHAFSGSSGGHAFSKNGIDWTSAPAAYDNEVPVAGGKTLKLAHRERPSLLFDGSGNPVCLYNGATMTSGFGWSFTTAVLLK